MRTVNFPESEVKELNRQIFSLYRYFSNICSKLGSEDKRESVPSDSLRSEMYPWLCYKFEDKDVSVSIHRSRKGEFSLCCKGILVDKVVPSNLRSRRNSDFRYCNYYGNYLYLGECVTLFNTVVANYCKMINGELF